jgi:hypothetical protein
MRDQACGDIRGTAGGKPDEQAYRTVRISLRPSDARDRRQRGSARGQMQKFAAGKFHFEPPFTSFDHFVGAGEQLVGRWTGHPSLNP